MADNAGLYRALKNNEQVQPIFIFDTNILSKLSDEKDARVSFIYDEIQKLNTEYEDSGGNLWQFHGKPKEIFTELIKKHKISKVITNRDYESYGIKRDATVSKLLNKEGIDFESYKDQVIFDKDEVVKKDGTPYLVFTPYKRKWLEKLDSRTMNKKSFYLSSYPTEKYSHNLAQTKKHGHRVTLKKMGFSNNEKIDIPAKSVPQKLIKNYDEQRDYPAVKGTSRLGMHLRFGTISIREKARKARTLSDTFLSELVWRDFYSMILEHFPHVEESSFRPKYDKISWRNNEKEFKAWCEGKTGYPMVDAGMRELNESGYMHNRVRMVVASFLTKHLMIDWRWGEAYFAEKLLDFDLASNNGGWQWAAGCGTDAAPYFRIFNPTSQQKKFDKEFIYIKKWIAEWGTDEYPEPIVEHKLARERCLRMYKEALDQA